MYNYLQHIDIPSDLKKLKQEELPNVAAEMRDFILDIVSVKSGHLGASLGVIELTLALHYHYNTPEDLLIWDVGHQAYGHKLLTGRRNDFETLRQWKGMAGFPAMKESVYDTFGTGHSSTSVSAVTGMALANRMKGEKQKHIAVIGDASIVSGMAFEGLNHLGDTDLDVLIILNDNNIGIDPAVGALQKHFNNEQDNSEVSFFKFLGFHYHGITDGHNIDELLEAFRKLDKIPGPKLLHVRTVKGKGYPEAEKDQILWHSPGKFDKTTGKRSVSEGAMTFQKAVGDSLNNIFESNKNVAAITPAMPTGSGLVELMKKFPERVWDVGIAEQHAVTLAAGLATQGVKPYCVIYSTFLQRAYDQVIHDVALQDLPVIFMIDRAGVVGTDGATHHGYFDISFLNSIPNMIVSCPADAKELNDLIQMSAETRSPFSIRYPKGEIGISDLFRMETELGKAKKIRESEKAEITVFTTGETAQTIHEAVIGFNINWFHFPFVKPMDKEFLRRIVHEHKQKGMHRHIITFESGMRKGGFGEAVRDVLLNENFEGKITVRGYPDEFIEHGSTEELNRCLTLDAQSIRSYLECLVNSGT